MNSEDWAFCRWNVKNNTYYLFHRRQATLDRQLQQAAKEGQSDNVRRLLKEGANPNARFRYTILGDAVICPRRNPECVRLLLEYSAEVNPNNRFIIAPLIEASHGSSEECIRLLVDAGARLNVFDPHFTGANTPLQSLIWWASLPLLQWVVAQGASIEMRGGVDKPLCIWRWQAKGLKLLNGFWLVEPMKTPKITRD
jgi:ankyrin repeat protein